jgi:hypothetical protein
MGISHRRPNSRPAGSAPVLGRRRNKRTPTQSVRVLVGGFLLARTLDQQDEKFQKRRYFSPLWGSFYKCRAK